MGGNGAPKLDQIDIRILAALQSEGRLSKVKLAERVGLSPSPAMERMRRLEAAGYIRGYHADINLSLLGPFAVVFVEVTLKGHESTDFQRFEREISAEPWITECYAIGGGIDYLLKVFARDIAHYQDLMDGLLERDIGIGRYFTYVMTKAVKQQPGLEPGRLLS